MILPEHLIGAREAKDLSQPALARLSGCSQQLINALEKGTTKSTKFLPKIANALGVDPGFLDSDWLSTPSPAPLASEGVIDRPLVEGRADFPVYASAEGGPGEIIRSTEPVDFIPRPTDLLHVRSAYGLLITGDSMSPEYKNAEMAIVEPMLPMVSGEVGIFYAERDGEARATIKHLRRATADNWLVTQHNPPEGLPKDFSLSRKTWGTVHRVTGKRTRR